MAEFPQLYGVVPIVVTPFDDGGRVDAESLRRLVDFNVAAGVHGLGIALGSEVYQLSDEERELVVGTVVDQANGRVPVVMNTGAPAPDTAVRHSRRAVAAGVDAVLCTSPGPDHSQDDVRAFFRAVSDAVDVPVMVQDTSDNHVPPDLLRSLGETVPRVRYAKVESRPPARRVYDAVQACDNLLAIFGGAGGGAFLGELRRGSIGTMPWPSTPRPFVEVWDHWQAGERDLARRVFDERITPVLRLSAGGIGVGRLVHKELLRVQGVIASSHVREPADEPDPVTWDELAETCALLGLKESE